MSEARRVKVWPVIGLGAIHHNAGGAWRAWTFGRHIDVRGSGMVKQSELVNFLNNNIVSCKKTAERWIDQAVKMGLFIPASAGVLRLAGPAKTCQVFNVRNAGFQVWVSAKAFGRKGWKANVLEAYNSTLSNPMSQLRKFKLTQIKPRTQRNWLKIGLGTTRQNYAFRNSPAKNLAGLREEGLAVFKSRTGKLIQRLPDMRIVPAEVAERANPGRRRKIQKQLNATLCSLALGNARSTFRLFCDTTSRANSTVRAVERSTLDNKPYEVFLFKHAGETANTWKVINVNMF